MTSSSPRIYARILLVGTVGFAVLIGHASTAGATTAPTPGVIVTFEVTATGQTPIAVEAATVPTDGAGNLAAYNRMLAVADTARAGCGVYQVDLAEASGPWASATVGVEFPADTPGALSAITGIVGTGTCDTPPAPTPAVDTVTDAPLTPAAVVDAPAAPFEAGTAIKLQRTGFVVTPMLPTTGSNSGELVLLGLSLIGAGVLVVKVTRRTV